MVIHACARTLNDGYDPWSGWASRNYFDANLRSLFLPENFSNSYLNFNSYDDSILRLFNLSRLDDRWWRRRCWMVDFLFIIGYLEHSEWHWIFHGPHRPAAEATFRPHTFG